MHNLIDGYSYDCDEESENDKVQSNLIEELSSAHLYYYFISFVQTFSYLHIFLGHILDYISLVSKTFICVSQFLIGFIAQIFNVPQLILLIIKFTLIVQQLLSQLCICFVSYLYHDKNKVIMYSKTSVYQREYIFPPSRPSLLPPITLLS